MQMSGFDLGRLRDHPVGFASLGPDADRARHSAWGMAQKVLQKLQAGTSLWNSAARSG